LLTNYLKSLDVNEYQGDMLMKTISNITTIISNTATIILYIMIALYMVGARYDQTKCIENGGMYIESLIVLNKCYVNGRVVK